MWFSYCMVQQTDMSKFWEVNSVNKNDNSRSVRLADSELLYTKLNQMRQKILHTPVKGRL